MKTVFSILGIICIGWGMWSCKKINSYSDIPEIRFKKLTSGQKNTALGIVDVTFLTFSFTDGNGDLGVRDTTTTDTLSRVYVIWQEKLTDGTYKDYTFINGNGTTIQPYRIPYDYRMNKDDAQNKVLKGEIEVMLFNPIASLDTVRLEFYIMDRALHKSNVDHSPNFKLSDK